jgi:Xaa-Pro dipeptidase
MIGAGSELMSIDPMIMSGRRAGYMPHIPYKRVRLAKGDPIYLEFSGSYERYNAPSMRSAVTGPPSDGIRRLADASLATVEILLQNIRAGRTGHDIAQDARSALDSVPEAFFHGGFGYSIGMGFQPTWTEAPMYIAEGIERELEPGMTFHLPICAWVPAQYGIGFSVSIVVTETGCEFLTPGRNRALAVR